MPVCDSNEWNSGEKNVLGIYKEVNSLINCTK